MKSWGEAVAGTWLGTSGKRARVQRSVNARLKAAGGHTPFPTIDQISVDVKALGLGNQWFWATTALVLTGELILCAEQGGTLSSKTCFSEAEAIAATQTIEILRNAVCHPGHVSHSSSGRPHVQALADHLERYAKETPEHIGRLRLTPHSLADRWVAELALFSLDALGPAFLGRFG